MKKKLKLLLVFFVLGFISCDGFLGKDNQTDLSSFEGREVSVYNGDKTLPSIESFQANVVSYYSHDKKGIEMKVQQEYRLSMKIIDGEIFSRIDVNADSFGDSRARTFISNDKETVCLYTDTKEIEARIPLTEHNLSNRLLPKQGLPMLGKVQLDKIVSTANRLSYDVDNKTPGVLTIGLPPKAFSSDAEVEGYSQEIVSYKLHFDTEDKVMASTEMVVNENDGTVQTTSYYPLYKDVDGKAVEVGSVTEIESDIDENLDVSDSAAESYDSIEAIPEVTEAEIEAMEAEGNISETDSEPWIGDPSDPDFKETYVELYNDVELNTLNDSYFRKYL